MYELLLRTVYALTKLLFGGLFPELLRNSGNKYQDNNLVSALTVRHSSTYIILYMQNNQQNTAECEPSAYFLECINCEYNLTSGFQVVSPDFRNLHRT